MKRVLVAFTLTVVVLSVAALAVALAVAFFGLMTEAADAWWRLVR